MLEVFYKPTFVKQYKKLPEALRLEVKEKIALLKQDPNHSFLKTHKLNGWLDGKWSFSVNYKYRVIFQYLSKDEAILLSVGDHDIYDS